jgi:hypothetical protein
MLNSFLADLRQSYMLLTVSAYRRGQAVRISFRILVDLVAKASSGEEKVESCQKLDYVENTECNATATAIMRQHVTVALKSNFTLRSLRDELHAASCAMCHLALQTVSS